MLEVVETKSSRVFFMMNIVLMIWLSQVVISSNLKDIPKSIYLISPLFSKKPIQNLVVTYDGSYPAGYDRERLGTLPDIQELGLMHMNISSWKKKVVEFCAQRIHGEIINGCCPHNTTKCNNICVSGGN